MEGRALTEFELLLVKGRAQARLVRQFDGAKFDGAKFDGAKFDGPKFDDVKFDGAKFDGAKFDGPRFDGAILCVGFEVLSKCEN